MLTGVEAEAAARLVLLLAEDAAATLRGAVAVAFGAAVAVGAALLGAAEAPVVGVADAVGAAAVGAALAVVCLGVGALLVGVDVGLAVVLGLFVGVAGALGDEVEVADAVLGVLGPDVAVADELGVAGAAEVADGDAETLGDTLARVASDGAADGVSARTFEAPMIGRPRVRQTPATSASTIIAVEKRKPAEWRGRYASARRVAACDRVCRDIRRPNIKTHPPSPSGPGWSVALVRHRYSTAGSQNGQRTRFTHPYG